MCDSMLFRFIKNFQHVNYIKIQMQEIILRWLEICRVDQQFEWSVNYRAALLLFSICFSIWAVNRNYEWSTTTINGVEIRNGGKSVRCERMYSSCDKMLVRFVVRINLVSNEIMQKAIIIFHRKSVVIDVNRFILLFTSESNHFARIVYVLIWFRLKWILKWKWFMTQYFVFFSRFMRFV